MISYAQNHEDAVLARLFTADEGFWVDIGAGHPVYDSITKHFSDRGWRGLNVEPLASESALLATERPRDINVRVAISDVPGTVTLHAGPPENRGGSTLDPGLAAAYRAAGQVFTTEDVPAVRLADLLSEHDIRTADFLKVDVEGHERRVLSTIDWSVFEARVVVVEATRPGSAVPSHESWEDLLLEQGYRCALFDGLNRFYARADDEAAADALATPANVFDEIDPWPWVERVMSATAAAHAARAELDAVTTSLADLAAEARRLAGIAEGTTTPDPARCPK